MSAESLRRQRGQLKTRLTTTKSFVSRASHDLDSVALEEIAARLQGVEDVRARFEVVMQELVVLVPEEEYERRDAAELAEFEERFYSIKASLVQLLERLKPTTSRAAMVTGDSSGDQLAQILEQQTNIMQRLAERPESAISDALAQMVEQQGQLLEGLNTRSVASWREPHVKLPSIKLPTFSGDIEEWRRYFDTFKTLIHDSELSNVQKHQYLVGSLSGAAAKVIESIEISEDNYAIAWNLLAQRYNDERGIRRRCIQCLFSLPQVSRESASAIQELLDHVQKHLRVLQAMKRPTEKWGDLSIHLIEDKLDGATRRRWEEHIEQMDDVTTDTIIEFLQRQSQLLRRTNLNKEIVNKSGGDGHRKDDKKQASSKTRFQNKASLATTIQDRSCCLCRGDHNIYSCKQFLNLSVDERIKQVKTLKLCLNCLRGNHYAKECKASSCKQCGARHNTLCHKDGKATSAVKNSERPTESSGGSSDGIPVCAATGSSTAPTDHVQPSGETINHHVIGQGERKHVLMSTAVVNVRKTNGGEFGLRVLLDSASEVNFITASACKRLDLQLDNVHESISGLNSMNCATKHGCRVQIRSRVSDFELDLYCLVVPKITKNLPSYSINATKLSIPENLRLADPFYHSPGRIDALIGGEFFFQLLQNEKFELGSNAPILQNTRLGWVVAGPIPHNLVLTPTTNGQISTNSTCLFIQQESIDNALQRFWELEEYKENDTRLSVEEENCEIHFISTTIRDTFGRFVVGLPFRNNRDQLGESKQVAMHRLRGIERRFHNNPKFHAQYIQFMDEYIKLNHMSKIIKSDTAINPIYLPHHGVLRESSATTKLRVVFDASAKTTSGISLNDTLMVGANLQDNIIDVMLPFRLPVIAISADLQKMYRQILIRPQDRDYQRILWRFSPDDPIEEYRLNTVTFGQACAPFLAIRCVRELATSSAHEFKQASQVLLEDMYVDDILTGVDSEADVIELISQLKNLLRSGGFEAHKWQSNCKSILPHEQAVDRVDESMEFDTNITKTLGLNWHPQQDTFQFLAESVVDSVATKRVVLSIISKLFDPLGLISPIHIRAKLIMQRTWALGLKWDELLSNDLLQAWNSYADDLRQVHTIRVPRVVRSLDKTHLKLHAFCDASLKAYGACIYVQAISDSGDSSSTLLCAKSRVAPIKNKTISLPRLELCGAVVLVRLLRGVLRALKVEFREIHAWSDSKIVLAWIFGDPSRQKTFVSNRTAEIQSVLPAKHWCHVSGSENPADLISRGTSLQSLKQCKLWWEGPNWLFNFNNSNQQEISLTRLSEEDAKEVQSEQKLNARERVFLNVGNSNEIIDFLLNNYSSLSKIERILAWMRRFILNVMTSREKRRFEHLSIDEIRDAHRLILLTTQKLHFFEERKSILAKRSINHCSKLRSLSPFLDKEGLLRVGGRIQNSQLTFERKHPILLPPGSKFTLLLFKREHLRLLHAGPQALLYSIRNNYWPLNGKNIARKTVHECVTCYRSNPKVLSQIMGQLPADRITPTRVFSITGVDFAGPITTLVNRGRGRKTNKSYISLFVCFVTRAIHLEAVSDLTTASFMAALRRFIGRRGCPRRIFSDNATNFLGARNELREMYKLITE